MSEVWLMVRQCMEGFGWIVSYFLIGLFVARRVRPPAVGSVIAFRLGAALLWPPVALFLVGRWFAMNGMLFMSDLIRTAIQWLGVGEPAAGGKSAIPAVTPTPTAIPAKNREAESLTLLYAEKQRIDAEIRAILDRMENKPVAKSARN